MFSATSRYHDLPTATLRLPDGRTVTYVRRRPMPDPDTLTTIAVHVVAHRERLDHIAARHLGDPEQAWRIADAHRVLTPAELTARPGRRLRVTLPAGLLQGAALLAPGGGPGDR
ncbi:LysM domain-containing protein [Streptomyces sp. NPDC048603]|uniref:LysM domain-containing protein n=1 Tax=Streptomyces sp. NPDC048603 TaxID=3365577 RepID=UPI00371513F4